MSSILLDKEIPIGDKLYTVGRLDAFAQLHVASEFRNILVGLALLKKNRPETMTDAEYVKTAVFMIASNGGISPEARDRVANRCLATVKRKEAMGWQPILSGSGLFQYDDIQLPELTELLFAVFEHNRLIDFFVASQSNSDGATEGTGQS